MNANPFNMGCTTSTTGINETEETNTISIYPNPMNSSTTIFSEMKNCSIKIMDVTGNIVKNINSVNQFPFTFERGILASGIYVLEIISADKIERIKLLVE